MYAESGEARPAYQRALLGRGAAVHTAIRHRDRVRRLVLVSTGFRRGACFPEIIAGFDALGRALAEPMKHSPVYAHYAKVAAAEGLLGAPPRSARS